MVGPAVEPRLDAEDRATWAAWERAAAVHARTRAFARRVEAARAAAGRALDRAAARGGARPAAVMWSGGKDSTALAHLVAVGLGAGAAELVSEKDDLDYPGERAFVEGLARAWSARLRVLTPATSPAAWLDAHAADLGPADDLHSRAAALSRACFYDLVEADNAGRPLVLLGLRAEESVGRWANRAARGLVYERRDGLLVGQPLADWCGLDVYAYHARHGLPLLDVYRCVGFLHRREPWRVRKSWWLPGAAGARGGVAWLRRYWPSLYRRLGGWWPTARSLA